MLIDCETLGELIVNASYNGNPNDKYSFPFSSTGDNDEYATLVPFPCRKVSVIGQVNENLRTYQIHKETPDQHSHLFFLTDYTKETIPILYVWKKFSVDGEESKQPQQTFFVDVCKYCCYVKNCVEGSYIHASGNIRPCASKEHTTNKNKLRIASSALRLIPTYENQLIEWHKIYCTQKKERQFQAVSIEDDGGNSSSYSTRTNPDNNKAMEEDDDDEEMTSLHVEILKLFQGRKKLTARDLAALLPNREQEDIKEVLEDLNRNRGKIYCNEDQIAKPKSQIEWISVD